MNFGEKLRTLRKKNKWSQNEFASKAGINTRAVSKYENNEMLPNSESVIKMAKILNISIDYLLLDENQQNFNDIKDTELHKLFHEVDQMESEDRHIVKTLIDAFVKKKKLENIIH